MKMIGTIRTQAAPDWVLLMTALCPIGGRAGTLKSITAFRTDATGAALTTACYWSACYWSTSSGEFAAFTGGGPGRRFLNNAPVSLMLGDPAHILPGMRW